MPPSSSLRRTRYSPTMEPRGRSCRSGMVSDSQSPIGWPRSRGLRAALGSELLFRAGPGIVSGPAPAVPYRGLQCTRPRLQDNREGAKTSRPQPSSRKPQAASLRKHPALERIESVPAALGKVGGRKLQAFAGVVQRNQPREGGPQEIGRGALALGPEHTLRDARLHDPADEREAAISRLGERGRDLHRDALAQGGRSGGRLGPRFCARGRRLDRGQDAQELAEGGAQRRQQLPGRTQLRARVARLDQDALELDRQPIEAVLQERHVQIFLALEVEVDGTDRKPGATGDFLDRGAGETALGEDAAGDALDLATSSLPVELAALGKSGCHVGRCNLLNAARQEKPVTYGLPRSSESADA